MVTNKKIRIGDLLIANGLINEDQLKTALSEQKNTGRRLGQTLIDMNLVGENEIVKLLSEHFGLPFINLSRFQFDEALVRQLPETLARRFRAILLSEHDGKVLVGMSDPMDILAADEISRAIKKPIDVAVVKDSEILNALDKNYRNAEGISNLATELNSELDTEVFSIADFQTNDESEAPVVKLLESILEDAVSVGASDIHIEPDEDVLRIRLRVDGMLREQVLNEARVSAALTLRLKLMSGLDISEKRLPQDGRFSVKVKNRDIDIRLSTLPTNYGESVVMRLLDQTNGVLSLEKVGLPTPLLDRFKLAIKRPHGMILVTGPTGSGKTTTLYGALSHLNDSQTKIITAEDPIEYRLPRICQVQVNQKVGLDFSKVLRSCLRQDPDVLLVGEMRDQETAEIGLRAAMTGHLVMSTLHTNDAISSAMRLLDMGAEPFLVASSLYGILSQRLIKKVCPDCKTEHHLCPQETSWLKSIAPELDLQSTTFWHGEGCSHCNHTGYKGRVGIYEWLEMDNPMLSALRQADTEGFATAARESQYYEPIEMNALNYARQGITSLAEVFRVSATLEDNKEDISNAEFVSVDESDAA